LEQKRAPFLLLSTFKSGADIPQQQAQFGSNLSPALVWTGQPEDTQDFALVMEDVNVPGGTKVHWLVYGLGAERLGIEGCVPRNLELPDGIRQGRNDFGTIGYTGPNPPAGAKHRYSFKLYALRNKLSLKIGADKDEFRKAVRIAGTSGTAELVGNFKSVDAIASGASAKQRVLPSPKQGKCVFLSEAQRARLDFLQHDNKFKRERAQLDSDLKAAYAKNTRKVAAFFGRFSFTSPFTGQDVQNYLARVAQPQLRSLFERYVKFANGFRVELRLRSKPLEFEPIPWPSLGQKFHVKIVGNHLEPVTPGLRSDDEPYRDSFESPNMKVLDEIQELIDKGQATFVQVEDGPSYSLLKDLELVVYKYNGIAFILHNTDPPFLACIFGEKMGKDLVADIGKSITEFQRKYLGRVLSGRPSKKS
jgi:Raf kinase inhibitor-like YbhB/YbcL family protein